MEEVGKIFLKNVGNVSYVLKSFSPIANVIRMLLYSLNPKTFVITEFQKNSWIEF
jgi:hypothetical protein